VPSFLCFLFLRYEEMAPPPPDRFPNHSPAEASSASSATPNHHSGESSKFLSPDTAPFYPRSTARSKSMRWDDFSLSDDSDGSNDEQCPFYLDVTRSGLSTFSPTVSLATAEDAPQVTMGDRDDTRERARPKHYWQHPQSHKVEGTLGGGWTPPPAGCGRGSRKGVRPSETRAKA
jgi:hypothetical protein